MEKSTGAYPTVPRCSKGDWASLADSSHLLAHLFANVLLLVLSLSWLLHSSPGHHFPYKLPTHDPLHLSLPVRWMNPRQGNRVLLSETSWENEIRYGTQNIPVPCLAVNNCGLYPCYYYCCTYWEQITDLNSVVRVWPIWMPILAPLHVWEMPDQYCMPLLGTHLIDSRFSKTLSSKLHRLSNNSFTLPCFINHRHI